MTMLIALVTIDTNLVTLTSKQKATGKVTGATSLGHSLGEESGGYGTGDR